MLQNVVENKNLLAVDKNKIFYVPWTRTMKKQIFNFYDSYHLSHNIYSTLQIYWSIKLYRVSKIIYDSLCELGGCGKSTEVTSTNFLIFQNLVDCGFQLEGLILEAQMFQHFRTGQQHCSRIGHVTTCGSEQKKCKQWIKTLYNTVNSYKKAKGGSNKVLLILCNRQY